MNPQEHAFRSGVDVVVATPGRLLDHTTRPYAKLSGLEYLVLDEADRMLDMGFLPDIKRILRHIPSRRQTLFFSATMPKEIAALASEMLKNPVTIALQRQAAPAAGITQAAYPVPQPLKAALLVELMRRGIMTQALVFTRTKHRADRLAQSLVRTGINAERIHGNRSQAQRTQALAGFKSGRYPVLVATNIAARGIDVEALTHVINFDVPAAADDYIHRVGRTGRADLTGEAFTFVSPDEESDLRAIERAIAKSLPRVTLPDFDYNAQAAQLEVPHRERIAAIRQRKREDRARAAMNAARRSADARHAGNTGARGTRRPEGTQGSGGASARRFRPKASHRRPS
jgi:ATP-dependent RNA helicase RhlE